MSPPDSTSTPSQPTSQPQAQLSSTSLSSSSSPKPSTSPPFPDTVIRPFTSQGNTFSQSSSFNLNYPPPPVLSERPLTSSHDTQVNTPPSKSTYGPYTSASARTSYTRVDVDSLPVPVYPPLPSTSVPPPSTDPIPTHVIPNSTDSTPTGTPTPPTHLTTTEVSQTNVVATALTTTEQPIPQMPQVSLTFLLVSGRRKTQSFDPETTVGRVKELVWNAWPVRDADWQDERPPAPSYLRILYLGKILQDDDTLLHIGFPSTLPHNSPTTQTPTSTPTPTIVHLSIRPYAPPSEDPALNKKKRLSVAIGRRGSGMTGGNGGVGGGVGGNGGGNGEEGEEGAGCCSGCVVC